MSKFTNINIYIRQLRHLNTPTTTDILYLKTMHTVYELIIGLSSDGDIIYTIKTATTYGSIL